MARVQIPVTALTRAGVAPPAQTNADATNNHVMVNDGRTLLEIVSSDAGVQTVSVTLKTVTVDDVAVGPHVISVPAGATRLAGPWPTTLYNQATVAADGTLTSDGTSPANNDTVTIGSQTYTFKTTLNGAANEILIGGSAAAAIANLKKAINNSGVAGTDYGTGTVANASVSADTLTSTTLHVTALVAGTGGNTIATTETSAHLSWGGATLSGGYLSNQVIFLAASVSTTLKFRAYTVGV
jgi:hypothetical protein